MIQKLGIGLTFWFYYQENKQGKTGLTVTASVIEKPTSSGAATIVSGQACTEAGLGLYYYTLAGASNDANGEYAAVAHTSTTTVDSQDVPALWTTPAWLTTLATASVTFVGPVTATGQISLTPGDDYFAVDGRSLDFTYTGVPSLTGATVTMGIRLRRGSTNVVTLSGSVLSATQIRFQPTSAETVLLAPDTTYEYQTQALLTGTSHVTTLEEGTISTALNLATP